MKAFVHDGATRAWAKLRPARTAGFTSSLRRSASAPALILSPHPDDAVLDCWSVLTEPRAVQVVNVFAGTPAGGSVTYYERLTGATDSAEQMRRRLGDDRQALALAGRAAVNLAFLGLHHRSGRPEPSFHRLDRALAARIPEVAEVYAPAALGSPHPDHELVRDYALRIARSGVPVWLYADLPYCAVYGWPGWVTAQPEDRNPDVDAYWRASAPPSLEPGPAGARVVELADAHATVKLAAMRRYGTEFPTLDRGPVGALSNRAIHRYEVFWPMPGDPD